VTALLTVLAISRSQQRLTSPSAAEPRASVPCSGSWQDRGSWITRLDKCMHIETGLFLSLGHGGAVGFVWGVDVLRA
jgi:hypothetical protein